MRPWLVRKHAVVLLLVISVKETSVRVVDEPGKVYRELKVVSDPDDLPAVLSDPALQIERLKCRSRREARRAASDVNAGQAGKLKSA